MKIHFLGGARTTTGSMYLLEINRSRILLECGLFQGKREESIQRNTHFPFDPAGIDAVVLSHAHIDHSGNLPNLVKQGFRGHIHCTFATRDLCAIMLEDSAHIAVADAEYVSKVRRKHGQPPVEPLYTPQDADRALKHFVGSNYDRPLRVADGVTVTFRDAGHLLGSAQVVLDIQERGRTYRHLFTGDVGRGHNLILRDPEVVEGVDSLQIESTYGTRTHEPIEEAQRHALKTAVDVLKQGGKVIVPAFAIGRTQELVYVLHRLMEAERVPEVPVYVDSPLAVRATEVYRLHPECFNDETNRFLREVANPFQMENLTYVRTTEESKVLNHLKGPAIIISSSGMAEAGRIRHHLKNHLPNPQDLVLFVGYCAEHTLGWALLHGKDPVNVFGEPVEVRAKILKVDAFSGHADTNELQAFVRRLTGNIRQAFVVHGEEEETVGFGDILRKLLPQAEVVVPTRGQTAEVQ
jgi:metallo-beta-lactamase family protein